MIIDYLKVRRSGRQNKINGGDHQFFITSKIWTMLKQQLTYFERLFLK